MVRNVSIDWQQSSKMQAGGCSDLELQSQRVFKMADSSWLTWLIDWFVSSNQEFIIAGYSPSYVDGYLTNAWVEVGDGNYPQAYLSFHDSWVRKSHSHHNILRAWDSSIYDWLMARYQLRIIIIIIIIISRGKTQF